MQKIVSFLKKAAVPVHAKKEDGMQYWRERILFAFSLTGIYAGFLILIPSIVASVRNNYLIVAIMDIFIYLVLVFFLSFRGFSYKIRAKSLFVITYILGVTLIIVLGPRGAGLIWLFSFPVFAGILEGLRSSIYASIINCVTTIVIGFFIYQELFSDTYFSEFKLDGWIAVGVNFIGLNAFIAISLGVLLNGMEQSIRRERTTKKRLKKERDVMYRLKEKAEKSDRLKTAFLTNVSHDIRTPMNSIIGFSDLLTFKKLDEEKQNKYLHIIKRQGGILLNLINDILDIAKIEANEINFEHNKISLNYYLNSIYEDFAAQIESERNKEVTLILEKAFADKESNVLIDANRLRQILNNLIGNALKFTLVGSITFGYEKKNQDLQFFVFDTGTGIPKENLDSIFDRFRKFENEPENASKGTGLGLSICKSLVQMQGGEIWVESEEGKGSKFYFTLPLHKE